MVAVVWMFFEVIDVRAMPAKDRWLPKRREVEPTDMITVE